MVSSDQAVTKATELLEKAEDFTTQGNNAQADRMISIADRWLNVADIRDRRI